MEHRWGERIALEVPVKLTVRPFALRQGLLTDLSVSGGFIRAADLRLLTRIQVTIEAPGLHLPTAVPAYVTRVCAAGAGVEWCEFAPRAILELIRAASHRVRPELEWPLPPALLTPPGGEPSVLERGV